MPCSSTVVLGCSVLAILALTAVVILRLSQGEEGKCPEGTFTCTKSFECIPKRYLCNKHDDCLDGEDETFSQCVDWIEGTASFFRKIKPKPANDSENDKPICDLDNYPTEFCICSGRSSLNCANAGLISLPAPLPRKVTSLFLMNNSLLVTDDIFEGFNYLKLLDLDNNKIRVLRKNAFRGMPALLRFDLSFNYLTLDNEKFPALPKLEYL
ncbi:hypothetical protein LSTR_LSTR005408 [Laodelphax striatellus]|uniref:LRRNT domain-containing protein n=1 Tax=Laodelphax striatellus TaxID=195883 RepID=A0A482WWP8_LAOST|nr:hypothetical protein LSTR_LSTR005408 [Laodelphax striatellus]